MDPIDTNIGGHNRRFLSTQWSMILAAGDPAHPEHREKWGQLAQAYWKPVYTYIRIAWKKSNEDAKDLAQDFFAYLLHKDYLSRMRPERGSFRAYLRRALGHFLVDAERYRRTRTPRAALVRIDAKPELLDRLVQAFAGRTPEEAFDREWYRCVLKDSISGLRDQLIRHGKSVYWEVFRHYCQVEDDAMDPGRTTEMLQRPPEKEPTYEELASGLGLKKHDVRNYLAHCRSELQRILRERIREYVARDEDVEDELREVLKG